MDLHYLITLCHLWVCLSTVLPTTYGDDTLPDDKFTKELNSLLTNVLKTDYMQDAVNKLKFSELDLTDYAVLSQITADMGSHIRNSTKGVHNMAEYSAKLRASEHGEAISSIHSSCCNSPETTSADFADDSDFPTKVNFNRMCSTHPVGKNITNEFSIILESNRRASKHIRFQNIGLRDGGLLKYPAARDVDCETYDSRTRAWYSQTATPDPISMIIIIDVTVPEQLLQLEKEAVKTILAILDRDDQIGILEMSQTFATFPLKDCLSGVLAAASDFNINKLITQLDKRRHINENPDYAASLGEANNMFHPSDQDRVNVVIFMTDGRNIGVEQTANILDSNIIVIPVGLGEGEPHLKSTAWLERTQLTSFPIMKETNDKYDVINALYDSLLPRRKAGSSDLTFVYPYINRYSVGSEMAVISVCLPLITNKTHLAGVACIDLSFDDLLQNFINFKIGQHSYPFVIDTNLRVVHHPLIGMPQYESPKFVNITYLERDVNREGSIFSDLKNRCQNESVSSGKLTKENGLSKAIVPFSHGNDRQDRVDWVQIEPFYRWQCISGSPFVVVLIVAVSDRAIEPENGPQSKQFAYHNFTFMHSEITNETHCMLGGELAYDEQSTVKFAPWVFEPASGYLNSQDNDLDIGHLKLYMESNTSLWTGSAMVKALHKSVKPMVGITDLINDPWLDSTSLDYAQQNDVIIMRKMVATENGVYREFPGTVKEKAFDHTRCLWYKLTIPKHPTKINKERITVTRPRHAYKSDLSVDMHRYVITVSKPLFVEDNQTKPVLIAVMGLDIAWTSFVHLLNKSYPFCHLENKSCIVIDDSGYILYHPDFELSEQMEKRHLYDKEGEIADKLTRVHLFRERCLDFVNKQAFHTWKVVGESKTEHVINNKRFTFQPIENTNLFLIIKTGYSGEKSGSFGKPARNSDTNHGYSTQCMGESEDHDCPCSSSFRTDNNYFICDDTYQKSMDNYPPCSATTEDCDQYIVPGQYDNNLHLKQCFEHPLLEDTPQITPSELETHKHFKEKNWLILGISLAVVLILVLVFITIAQRCLQADRRPLHLHRRPSSASSGAISYENEDESCEIYETNDGRSGHANRVCDRSSDTEDDAPTETHVLY